MVDTVLSDAPHPGKVLAERLAALGMSASELARSLGIPINRVTHIINGQRGVSGDSALRLGRFFGTAPAYWLGLQMAFELRRAEEEKGEFITRTVPIFSELERSRKTPQGSLFLADEAA